MESNQCLISSDTAVPATRPTQSPGPSIAQVQHKAVYFSESKHNDQFDHFHKTMADVNTTGTSEQTEPILVSQNDQPAKNDVTTTPPGGVRVRHTHCDLVVGHPVGGCDLVSDPVADRCGRLGTHAGDVVGHVLDAVQEPAGGVVSSLEGRVHLEQSETVRVKVGFKVRVSAKSLKSIRGPAVALLCDTGDCSAPSSEEA